VKINIRDVNCQQNFTKVRLRCPFCRHLGTLDQVTPNDCGTVGKDANIYFGIRRCPNLDCLALIFVIYNHSLIPITSYPAARLDFDATNIPAAVSKSMEEAVACHAAECFIASAIMVRKTLEELCLDRGATGANLKERIKALQAKILIPQELLDGADDLRLLGNDAAHIGSQEFNQVGKEEVEIGIEFAKEVLKAVYQYSALLQKLRSLKKKQP
jgi:Domain of unknown function (DUF4145)